MQSWSYLKCRWQEVKSTKSPTGERLLMALHYSTSPQTMCDDGEMRHRSAVLQPQLAALKFSKRTPNTHGIRLRPGLPVSHGKPTFPLCKAVATESSQASSYMRNTPHPSSCVTASGLHMQQGCCAYICVFWLRWACRPPLDG